MNIPQLIAARKTKPVAMRLPAYKESDYQPQDTALWNIEAVNAAAPWEETEGQAPVGVVCDTGVDIYHSELKPAIYNPINVTSDGPPNNVYDYKGHGTHVAGIVHKCYAEARVMPVKVFGQSPTGWEFQDGFKKILEYNRQVMEKDKAVAINCSWGGGYDPILHYLIKELNAQGVTIIASAGNSGDGNPDTDEIFSWPAYLYEPITVGAVAAGNLVAAYSSSYDGIDLTAPGTDIYSTWPNEGHKVLSGTSMAAPHVTALVLRIYAAFRQREGRYPACEEVEPIIWQHVKKLNQRSELVGRGLTDFTYDRRRWPLLRVQLGAFFFESGAQSIVDVINQLRQERPELPLKAPIIKKYVG